MKMLLIESHVLNVFKCLAVDILSFNLEIWTYDKLFESLSWHFFSGSYEPISECVIMLPIYVVCCGLSQIMEFKYFKVSTASFKRVRNTFASAHCYRLAVIIKILRTKIVIINWSLIQINRNIIYLCFKILVKVLLILMYLKQE